MSLKAHRQQEKLLKQARKKADPTPTLREVFKLYQSGNLKLALKVCQAMLSVHRRHPELLSLTGSIYLDLGQTRQSVQYLQATTKILPDDPQTHYNLGTALAANGELDAAISSHHHALQLKPHYPEALFNLANTYRQLDQTKIALTHYQNTLNLAPHYPGAATNLASCLLELGQPQQAFEASESALQLNPTDRDALAFKAIAAREVGDRTTADTILCMDEVIQARQLDAIDNSTSLATFNQALATHVLSHPTLKPATQHIATQGGQQTGNLALEPKGPIAQLEAMIIAAYDSYLTTLKRETNHFYIQQIPTLRKIDIWGTVLDSLGYQAAHMHRNAWISGVYYVQLPNIMRDTNTHPSGWIEFGRPPDYFSCAIAEDVRLFEPREGQMLLFPSFIYHRTIPFKSTEQRISIAFDLLSH